MDYLFDNVDVLSDIYMLESFHSDIVKDNFRVKHMEAIHESEEIIMEAFSDVIQKMGEYFKKLIQAIKDFFKKLLMYIASYLMDIDKFVKTYKSELDKIRDVKFTVYGYNFKLDTKPNLSELQNIINSYNDTISSLGKLKKADILVEQNKYLSSKNLDELRGKVLGSEQQIEEDNFADEVRKFYRDGELDTVEIEVDDSLFREVINNASELSKQTKEAEKLRDNSIILFNKAERFFSKTATTMYKDKDVVISNSKLNYDSENNSLTAGDTVTNASGKREVIDTFIRFKYNQTKTLSAMVNLVVREYANAHRDKVKMYREILRKSLFDSKTDSDADTSTATKSDDDD